MIIIVLINFSSKCGFFPQGLLPGLAERTLDLPTLRNIEDTAEGQHIYANEIRPVFGFDALVFCKTLIFFKVLSVNRTFLKTHRSWETAYLKMYFRD